MRKLERQLIKTWKPLCLFITGLNPSLFGLSTSPIHSLWLAGFLHPRLLHTLVRHREYNRTRGWDSKENPPQQLSATTTTTTTSIAPPHQLVAIAIQHLLTIDRVWVTYSFSGAGSRPLAVHGLSRTLADRGRLSTKIKETSTSITMLSLTYGSL